MTLIDRAKAVVRHRKRRVKIRTRQLTGARRKLEQARRALARARRDAHLWGGSRAVTNEIIGIVNGRASVSSRKRPANHPLSIANPGSDHNEANVLADAVDFRIAEAHDLQNEVSRRLGGPSELPDFGTFLIERSGHMFRVQLIAGTHGTGPHFHAGVKQVG